MGTKVAAKRCRRGGTALGGTALGGTALVCMALLLTGCGGGSRAAAPTAKPATARPATARPATARPATTVEATTTTAKRSATTSLVIENATEAGLAENFNPFITTNPLVKMGVTAFIYEPLLQYNELAVDQYYSWLAESWAFSSSGQTITFNLRPGVRWADGAPFSAADVAYSFNLLKDYPSINPGIPIVSATATAPATFTLTLSQPGYAYLFEIARVPIVKAGFAAGANPSTYVDKAPDGTGPYELASAKDMTHTKVTLTARPGYWQRGQPSIDQLVFPAYPDSAAVITALEAGTLDWASAYVPKVEANFVDKDRATNQYWFPPVDTISLEMNMARYPTDQLAVRRAISYAIDRSALSRQTEGGYDPPATSASGLVLPTDQQYLERADTNDIEVSGDAAGATRTMAASGYRIGRSGYWTTASGQTIAFSIEDPRGTPLAAMATVLAKQLRAAGFDVAPRSVAPAEWHADLQSGLYDAAVATGASGPAPYYMYRKWLDPALLVDGRASGGDYVRLSSSTAPSLAARTTEALNEYVESPTGSTTSQAAIVDLASTVAEELPVVPLLYGVAWGELSTRTASGWPDGGDPYEPPAPAPPYAEYTVLQLSPS